MAFGVQRRYYCANVAGCRWARADHPFSEAQFRQGGGRCAGAADDGCGEPLREGRPLDRRPAWLAAGTAAALALAAAVVVTARVLFPPPIAAVAFGAAESRTPDSAALLSIPVRRDAALDRRVTVRFETVDGTARAGADYEATRGELTFEPGERSKALTVTIVPDATHQKGERHFSVRLANVAGEPRHVVFIHQPPVNRDLQTQADQTVRAASVVAKDIADHGVRVRVIGELLAASRHDAAVFRRYQEAQALAQGNLTRARESYAQFFRDMQAMQPRIVLQSMDTASAALEQQGFSQQAQATAIMKRQFGEYLSRKSMDLDRWTAELGTAVPRLPPAKARPST